jgi:hypothetical protein
MIENCSKPRHDLGHSLAGSAPHQANDIEPGKEFYTALRITSHRP